MAQAREHLGVTQPVSTKFPEPADFVATREMTALLVANGSFEEPSQEALRSAALTGLKAVVEAWTKRISGIKGVDGPVNSLGRVLTFGSCELGVATPGADIDVVVVVAKHIERRDFFSTLVGELVNNTNVSELHPVKEAKVPVVKLNWGGIDMDILFARLQQTRLPDIIDLQNDSLLRNMDEQSVLSLNGSRVTDAILRLVPDVDNFKLALRFIKTWAKNRQIYSNVLGYFAGVSLALLMARVCQLYPNALPNVLVTRFFRVYGQWGWPQPVILCHTVQKSPGLNFKVWNPKANFKDGLHILPVITPVFPAMNSTAYVSKSTMRVIKAELNRGDALATALAISSAGRAAWEEILAPTTCFSEIRHFLCLEIASATASDHVIWCDWGYGQMMPSDV